MAVVVFHLALALSIRLQSGEVAVRAVLGSVFYKFLGLSQAEPMEIGNQGL